MPLTDAQINALDGLALDEAVAECKEAKPTEPPVPREWEEGEVNPERISDGDMWIYAGPDLGWMPAETHSESGYAALELLEEFKASHHWAALSPNGKIKENYYVELIESDKYDGELWAYAPDIATAACRCYLLAKAAGIGEQGEKP